MYTMGVYQLYEGNYQLIDSIRARFYWQGTGKKRKYHMIKWEALCRPKEAGGMGFMDVRDMNISLLAKWIDRLEREDSNICCNLLRRKYLGEKSIFQIKSRQGSQFWRSLLDIRGWFQRGRVIQVISGRQTRFWQDCWVGECPLKTLFPNIFSIALHPDLDVCQAFSEGQWHVLFRRQLQGIYRLEWEQLQELLMDVHLGVGRDKMIWALEQSRKYTSGSLYRAITFGGVRDQQLMNVWKCNIPLKVKNFIWMAAHDRIQSGVQLKKKKWSGPEECAACDSLETTDHILFQCPLAVYL